ncbi:MAG TPA: molybdopterin-dependent oxidoreductase [Methylomirabilota bacterium]|nr:molybdopterin-dependent oxidoreductase [Methylomirabilota bacterium]
MTTRTVRTMCPMNCHPTFCGMLVDVADDGRVLAVKGDPDNPDSRGFLCIRGRAAVEIPGNARRLTRPLVRDGRRGENRWRPVSWEEALDRIVSTIDATRRERVGFWFGHGAHVTGINRPLIMRFGHLGGMQVWNPAIVCWAMGAYGLGITGVIEANTKEDMAEHSRLIVLWGANLASQPTTAPHLVAARKRGTRVVAIDVRRTEASRHADETWLIRPGTDAALALAMAHVIVSEALVARDFVAQHTVGYEAYAEHLKAFSPEWAERETGLAAEKIRGLAREYATSRPAMIVVGGASMYKHRDGWQPGRAIATLPALTGQLGVPGGGLGPRHRSFPTGDHFADLSAVDRRPRGPWVPSHMRSIARLIKEGGLDVLLTAGTDMLNSFSDTGAIERDLAQVGLIVAYDIFANDTIRRVADIVLPGTIWLEDLGIKETATHLYLMDKALEPAGDTRPLIPVLRDLADRLAIEDFFPWPSLEAYMDALLAHQQDGALTVGTMRKQGGMAERSRLDHVPYRHGRYATPSGKVEFYSERAASLGLPELPSYTRPAPEGTRFPLEFRQGRVLTAFHSFYDNGRALPMLERAEPHAELWIHPKDAGPRGIAAGGRVELANERGRFEAVARVTEDILPGVVWARDGWPGLNTLTSGEACLTPEASEGLDPRIPGGQSAYDARVEVRPISA